MLIPLFALALATVPDTARYVVLNHGRPAGEMVVATGGDSATVRFVYQDRQRGPRVQVRYRFGSDGSIVLREAAGLSAASQPTSVAERFEVSGNEARWTGGGDNARVRAEPGVFYLPRGGTPYDRALLAAHLLRQPGRTARLLPVGSASVEIVADTAVTVGGRTVRIRLAAIRGLGFDDAAVWLDEGNGFFASDAAWFATVPAAAIPIMPLLREIEKAWRAQRSQAVATRLAPPVSSALVIRNGDVFDAERGVVRPRTTVVIERDRITAVGSADSIRIPAGARVIDATGKTVIPGLWDMHTHLMLGSESNGLLHLAAGITTVRDVAADFDIAVDQRARTDAGSLLGARILLAGFLEGPGHWAGPSDALAGSVEEALTWIARYDSAGYRQLKLYNLIHPDLLPAIAQETKRRGMRLSGHIPRGLSVPAAIALGFDEIQHVANLMSTFYQDSLYVPTMRAYSQVAAAVAPTFDPSAVEVTRLIDLLRTRGTVVDGTFNLWQDRSRPLADGSDPVFGSTIAWLPPVMQRSYRAGGGGSPEEVGRAQAASAAYRGLLKRLFDAGVTLVPGTDNLPGFSLHGELEIYERAGIPAASVLQIATLVPARVMQEDRDYGSIEVGKVADIAIVGGRPAERITDLRRVEQVVRVGKLYRVADIHRELGVVPMQP
ncbi:MAG: amidohydrolase family protein [Gemmatimonadales bacterium]